MVEPNSNIWVFLNKLYILKIWVFPLFFLCNGNIVTISIDTVATKLVALQLFFFCPNMYVIPLYCFIENTFSCTLLYNIVINYEYLSNFAIVVNYAWLNCFITLWSDFVVISSKLCKCIMKPVALSIIIEMVNLYMYYTMDGTIFHYGWQ